MSVPSLDDAILDTKPSVSELITRVGGHVFHKWKEFGDHLHIQPSLIEAVHKEELGRCESAFRSLCSKWLEEDNDPLTGDRRRTWRTVLDAVRKSREVGAAEDVKISLLSRSSESTSLMHHSYSFPSRLRTVCARLLIWMAHSLKRLLKSCLIYTLTQLAHFLVITTKGLLLTILVVALIVCVFWLDPKKHPY